jgi:hypothetical protein
MYGLYNGGLDQPQASFVDYSVSAAQLLNRLLRAALKGVDPGMKYFCGTIINSLAEALNVNLEELMSEYAYAGTEEWRFLEPFREPGKAWYPKHERDELIDSLMASSFPS